MSPGTDRGAPDQGAAQLGRARRQEQLAEQLAEEVEPMVRDAHAVGVLTAEEVLRFRMGMLLVAQLLSRIIGAYDRTNADHPLAFTPAERDVYGRVLNRMGKVHALQRAALEVL